MRIHCERCQSQYEMDEGQLQGRLEVQCSVCAHVFPIKKEGLPAAAQGATWFVRTSDGKLRSFANLSEVQGSIREGRLAPHDALTRDHRTWQTLADVPDLAPIFQSKGAGMKLESAPQVPVTGNETSRLLVAEPKPHGVFKVGVGLAVAAGVAFAGIRWQQDRNLHFPNQQAQAAVPDPHRGASPAPDTTSANNGMPLGTGAPNGIAARQPLIQALPTPPEPKKETPAPSHGSESYERLVAEADRALENGASNRAKELYHKAVRLRPGGFQAMTGLGFVALDRHQLSAAYSQFKRALTAKTSYPPALFGIAEVHRARGEKSLALHSYQRYLDMAPSGADASAARRQLQNLKSGR